MSFDICIKITMATLTYLLENGLTLNKSSNFNKIELHLTEKGFILKEFSRFDVSCDNVEELMVSPIYVIGLLFPNMHQKSNIFNEIRGFNITDYINRHEEIKLNNQISFIDLVTQLDSFYNHFNSGVIDINYLKLKKQLKEQVKDNYAALRNEIFLLNKLSYEQIANLATIKPSLARKIERLYQIETTLEYFCKLYLIEEKCGFSFYDKFIEDQSGLETYFNEYANSIDLSKYKIDWQVYYNIISNYTLSQITAPTHTYDENKTTVMGIKKLVLPEIPIKKR